MQFYVIRPKSDSFAQPMSSSGMKIAEKCQWCKRGGEYIPPLSIFFEKRNIPDFNFFSPEIIVTGRVKEVFEKNAVKGVDFLKISYAGDSKVLQGKELWQLNVTGRANASSECNIELVSECESCGRQVFSTWDGGLRPEKNIHTDILRVKEHWGYVFVNERVKRLIEDNNLVNVNFIQSEEHVDKFAWMFPRTKK